MTSLVRTAAMRDEVWAILEAADRGDVGRIGELVAGDPALAKAEHEGTRPLHVAVRRGHADVVRVLLRAGADAFDVTTRGDELVALAAERGFDDVEAELRSVGAAPGVTRNVEERWRAAFEPVDLALWRGPFWNVSADLDRARELAGDAPDLVVRVALGDLDGARAELDRGVGVDTPRPSGKRALSTAIEFGHDAFALELLERGADPSLAEGEMAPRGSALHAAARLGRADVVDALLAHGADPNSYIDSSGSATYAAKTPELRERLLRAGGTLDPYDLVWLGDDDAVVRAIEASPESALRGCGTVFAALCTLERRDLFRRVLALDPPLPKTLDGCRSYLLEQPDMLEELLRAGLDPDLLDWQRTTLLHECCARDRRGRARPAAVEAARVLLDAGATLEARDADLEARPLAWAAREGLTDVADLLLERGAAVESPEDPAWARPLGWAEARGHEDVVRRLRR